MRFSITLLAITLLGTCELVGQARSAEPPTPKVDKKQDTLKQLEGVWELKSAIVVLPTGSVKVNFDAPNTPKAGLTVKGAFQEMTLDGKPIPNGQATLKLGSEAECLLLYGLPEQKPYKERFKIEGDTLIIVQDLYFKEECPESFDPEKGRNRDRRVLTFVRSPGKR
jgi:hypothetical protein